MAAQFGSSDRAIMMNTHGMKVQAVVTRVPEASV